jgi:hypothetical protein
MKYTMFFKYFPPAFGLFVFLVMFSIVNVIFDTVNYDPPFQTYNDSAEIVQYPDYTVFVYRRELSVEYDIYGTVDRYVVHDPSGRTIQLDSSGQIYKKAHKRPVYREFRLPPRLEKGQWCLYAYLKYRPGWSVKDHVFEAPKVCARVN